MNIDYKDWYLNQKRVPDRGSDEYDSFFSFHKEICLNGAMMDGVFINPFLYWHINFWHTEVDVLDERGRISQKYACPYLRDNEWVITNEIERAHNEKKGLVIGGIRRLAKSVLEASYIGWGATFDENSQNVIAGLNSPDIKLITDKLDKGLNFLPEAWRWQRVEDDWKKQVTLGIKTKIGERIPFSQILIRNLADGLNEEAIAGTKPRKLIIDEGGKGSFLRALQAAIPGFTTPYGWTCSPIITFTGGDMTKFMDAKSLMFDVDNYNFLTYKNEQDEKRTHGLFMSYKYRMEAKTPSTLGNFLDKPKESPLHNISMWVADEYKAKEITETNLLRLKKAGDRLAYLKEKMYYPMDIDDIFCNEDTNIFDIEAAKRQKSKLLEQERTGKPVVLYVDTEGKIKHEFTDKDPITNFPLKNTDLKDAPIVIYEFPVESPPYGLYTAGVDPYRQGKAVYSTSLGAVYIYKRMHDITGEKYQDMFVASYCARPDKKEIWEEQSRLLIKYYNARTLCENDDISFIEYMKAKGDSHYLEKQPEWLLEIVPNTTVKREFGVHRSAEKIRDFLHNSLKQYLESVSYSEEDEKGNIIKQVLGVNKVFDPMLLEEIIQYNDVDNFDRIIACFTKDNIVQTEKGYKNIQDVQIDDKVLTHNGRYKSVIAVSKTHLNKGSILINIKPLGFEKEITCTKEHPFLVSHITKGTGKNYFKNFSVDDLQWKSAEELSLSDYLFIPKRQNLESTIIDKRLLYLIGWYLADGNRTRNNVRITFQTYQKHIAEYLSKLIQEFDAFGKIYVTHLNYLSHKLVTGYRNRKLPRIYKIPNKEAYNLEFNSTIFNQIIDDNILIKKGGEKTLKKELFNSDNLLPLVLGFLEGDGHQKCTLAPGSVNTRDTIEISGVYQDLIKQIRQILFDNNIWVTTNFNKQKNLKARMQLRLDIQDREGINKIIDSIEGGSKKFKKVESRPQRKNHIITSEGILVPIKKLEKQETTEDTFVYNMEVDEDNSYTISNLTVHNCELAIAQAIKMDPILGRIGGSDDSRIKALFNNRTKPTLFAPSKGLFNKPKQKLFR